MNRVKGFIVGFYILLLLVSSSAAADFPTSFPTPPNSKISIVSDDAQTLGMNLTIRKFITTKSKEEVVKFYQKKWRDQAATTLLAPWTMVGTRVNNKFYNVQVQSQSRGSWGFLSVSDLPGKIDKKIQNNKPNDLLNHFLDKEFAAMNGTRTINSQQHSDLLNNASTRLMTNRFSIEANRNFYLQRYKAQGWNLKQDSENTIVKSRVLLFNKGNRNLSFTINYIAGETQIVANLIAAKRLGGIQ